MGEIPNICQEGHKIGQNIYLGHYLHTYPSHVSNFIIENFRRPLCDLIQIVTLVYILSCFMLFLKFQEKDLCLWSSCSLYILGRAYNRIEQIPWSLFAYYNTRHMLYKRDYYLYWRYCQGESYVYTLLIFSLFEKIDTQH